jgi:hypothetical protein
MKPPTFAPAYVGLFPILAEVAQRRGYALAVHGSVSRDFDLIAVPWTDEAVPVEDLVRAIARQVGISDGSVFSLSRCVASFEQKPHGRIAWSIPLSCGAYIDLSVMPRVLEELEP